MPIRVALNHTTVYTYDRLVSLGPQVVRLRPAPHCRTKIEAYSLSIAPESHFLNWQQDPFGNYLARAVFPEKLKRFSVTVDLVAEHSVFNPFDFFLEEDAREFPFSYEPSLRDELMPYLAVTDGGEPTQRLVESLAREERMGTVDFLIEANRRITDSTRYIVRLEPGVQTCDETLELGSGSCRDMAWLLCQVLRRLGLATRFASGYLIQLTPDEKAIDGPSGTDHDFTDLHAWTEVYIPGAGWVGLDPTSGLLAGEGHIPLCCTPTPQSAAPISGTVDASNSTLEHTMSVTRIAESRRISRPYTDEEWAEIDAAGRAVDEALRRMDVRLTMGGEPTFVSVDDRDAPEWTVAANGVRKKERATKLFDRLADRFAPGGMRHHGQGKWYPGEPLPRWALSVFWRKDGVALWPMADGAADDNAPASGSRPEPTTADAEALLRALAANLGVPNEAIVPAYEDAFYHAWREGTLPVSGDPLATDLYERSERERLLRLIEKGLRKPVGYALPLMYSVDRDRWISNRWEFRGGTMFLIPGDSPIGLRLPTASLPFVPENEIETIPEPSGFAPVGDLPALAESERAVRSRRKKKSDNAYFERDSTGRVRTSICAEVRGGVLYVFLPPIVLLEHFVDLITAVRLAAEEAGVSPVIEGYSPPIDVRLHTLKVTPDPGVIEVNVHPAADWDEVSSTIIAVYDEARRCRLSADKFLLDGQRVGTGGGNHIVLGGPTPADSPFLRRPSLLRSMLSFWHNHPSLSYLFSSLFIGPTSQAPRVDEARDDMLYELEIACSKIDDASPAPPWLVDRLFRHILVDVSGNTHRAEFCIDKLFSPDGESGRLGLVELRNFEMPPHPQMSAVQVLLVRAAVAQFWERPYAAPLTRWGTRLHDDFMLPHYVLADFADVLSELSTRQMPLRSSWFEAFSEFRFPVLGGVTVAGAEITLRRALEPWHVLGEEGSGGGVSRAVDASVTRIQVSVRGELPADTVVCCNHVPLPLQPTTDGSLVAGVRYKAWAPPSSLHPTIPVHTPLVIEAIDRRRRRSLGGCTLHVAHPGGRNYETMPVNENEAEGRRLALFEAMGHSPGRVVVQQTTPSVEYPHTLDLRRYQAE